jgi:hypothetical protein
MYLNNSIHDTHAVGVIVSYFCKSPCGWSLFCRKNDKIRGTPRGDFLCVSHGEIPSPVASIFVAKCDKIEVYLKAIL